MDFALSFRHLGAGLSSLEPAYALNSLPRKLMCTAQRGRKLLYTIHCLVPRRCSFFSPLDRHARTVQTQFRSALLRQPLLFSHHECRQGRFQGLVSLRVAVSPGLGRSSGSPTALVGEQYIHFLNFRGESGELLCEPPVERFILCCSSLVEMPSLMWSSHDLLVHPRFAHPTPQFQRQRHSGTYSAQRRRTSCRGRH